MKNHYKIIEWSNKAHDLPTPQVRERNKNVGGGPSMQPSSQPTPQPRQRQDPELSLLWLGYHPWLGNSSCHGCSPTPTPQKKRGWKERSESPAPVAARSQLVSPHCLLSLVINLCISEQRGAVCFWILSRKHPRRR